MLTKLKKNPIKGIIDEDVKQLGQVMTSLLKENKEIKARNQVYTEGSEDIVILVEVKSNRIVFANKVVEDIFGIVTGRDYHETIDFHFDYNSMEIGKAYKRVQYNERLNKILYVVDIVKELDGDLFMFERAVNLNGETKQIIELGRKHNLD